MDVEEAADQLYALPPSDFISARDVLVRQARVAGDRDLAAAIADLRKPTAVAWLANRLARERADQLADFLALGAPLREATESLRGPALRDLSRQRQQLVQALVREARRVASTGQPGPRVSEDVARGLEATLHAALADPAAAASVASGRLSGALSHSGFGAPSTSGVAAADVGSGSPQQPTQRPPRPAKRVPAAERRAAARAQLETELEQAWATAREAAEERDAAVAAAAAAETSCNDVEVRVGALQDELRTLSERLAEAERASEHAREERTRTALARAAAVRRAERARTSINNLQTRLESLPNS